MGVQPMPMPSRNKRRLLQASAACALIAGIPSYARGARSPAVPASGHTHAAFASFDETLSEFVAAQGVPGAALAVTKNGRLVYARGFGVADRELGLAVRPNALFRIASISKPLTAVAVLQLAERGKCSLGDRVWELLELTEPLDARWKRVTILHLLQHTGGWDRNANFDPMFRPLMIARALNVPAPAAPRHIIQYMLGQRLDFEPGSASEYSNFGYCLLGRVIERVAGTSYEAYVRDEVLAPLGIRRMRLGRTLRSERAADEVVYYDEEARTGPALTGGARGQLPLPYGGRWSLEAMDAHGGWIASAPDLVRFASAFDDPASCRILRAESIARMFARPEGPPGHEEDGRPLAVYYGCGWLVRPFARLGESVAWHNGSLAGSSTLLVRNHHDVNWVALFNARVGPDGRLLDRGIDKPLHIAARHVPRWPDVDQFPQLL